MTDHSAPQRGQTWTEAQLRPLHLKGRQDILCGLRRELVGPDLTHEVSLLDLNAVPSLSYADGRRVWKDQATGEEVLLRDPPSRRYSIGSLFPSGTSMAPTASEPNPEQQEPEEERTDPDEAEETLLPIDPELEKEIKRLEQLAGRTSADAKVDEADTGAISLRSTNDRLPSAAAISFLADLEGAQVLTVTLPNRHPQLDVPVNARYERFGYRRLFRVKPPQDVSDSAPEPTYRDRPAEGFVRRPVSATWRLNVSDLLGAGQISLPMDLAESAGLDPLELEVQVTSRPVKDQPTCRLITVSLINRTSQNGVSRDCGTLFQTHAVVELQEEGGARLPAVLPYPENRPEDPETRSSALLYREMPAFASGHGCAADWTVGTNQPADRPRAHTLHIEFMPFTETPSITPDIEDEQGQPVRISMRALAGLDGHAQPELITQLERVVTLYGSWISRQEERIPTLPQHHQAAAHQHLSECRVALGRMAEGVTYLQGTPVAWRAFQLANHAILLQQIRSRHGLRVVEFGPRPPITFNPPFPLVTDQPDGGRGSWRAFQIAFLLLSVASTAQSDHAERELVDLIFFPTGGGKTEAYLGLTAFACFLRRLEKPLDAGVHVLMRYTLRLLTAQQFQRAASLMCAMEYLHRQPANISALGPAPFSVGIWLGSSVTPNSREEAARALKALENPDSQGGDSQNPFMLRRCPWCGAEMGVRVIRKPRGPEQRHVLGYTLLNKRVVLHCSDDQCDFHLKNSRNRGLPVVVTDDEVYETRPMLLIGTVDKFAQLAWNPEARTLFGLDKQGDRVLSPPGLIIQDELHLISGPLGSMTGLLEPVIEHLCTQNGHKPKIVCSTATIRAYREQVRDLYGRVRDGRGNAALFPPPGLDASDAFFATFARERDPQGRATGPLLPGRMYLGVSATGFSSLQLAQIKTYSALLNAPLELPREGRDPWWTLLAFFGSLQELGTSLTLLRTYVPSYLDTMRERYGRSYAEARKLYRIEELTGRLTSEEVPAAIEKLEERHLPDGLPDPKDPQKVTLRQRAVDMCLASSIIEVGVDIPRLSLMTILSQPKTTAQYIQVSGRVGREWQTRPGLVVTVYSPTRPRDRSHFERFRSYHEHLYAQVEPTSVTPFSPQSMRRALHLALVAFIRQYGPFTAPDGTEGVAYHARAIPEKLLEEFTDLMRARIAVVDEREQPTFEALLAEKVQNWRDWTPEEYEDKSGERVGLISRAGSYVPEGYRNRTWMTPNSLRNVDATCEGSVTSAGTDEQNKRARTRSQP